MVTSRSGPEQAHPTGPSFQAKITGLLKAGEIVSCDLSPAGSNYTFFVKICSSSGEQVQAVYKPRDGEAPLWDFDSGSLYKREYAAYLLSQILGWHFIPETVVRDGPYGVGSVQRYVDHDSNSHYRTLRESHREELRTIACFDIIANNADRKSVHCFEGPDSRVWGIDHGLTFNQIPKLRTVIWDFWGEPLPKSAARSMRNLLEELAHPDGKSKELVEMLHSVEIEAMVQRVNWLLETKSFPKIRRG